MSPNYYNSQMNMNYNPNQGPGGPFNMQNQPSPNMMNKSVNF